jgi:hypothetical protein
MEKEIFYEYPGEKTFGDGILLNEFRGEFSLVAAKSKDGKTLMEWVYPQKRDGSRAPQEKSLPWKIKLGTKDEAIQALRFFLAQLEGAPASNYKTKSRRDDVPIGEPPPDLPYEDEPPF